MQLNNSELRAELARRSWSQGELARAAGLSRSLVGWICRGARARPQTVTKILEALGPDAANRVVSDPKNLKRYDR